MTPAQTQLLLALADNVEWLMHRANEDRESFRLQRLVKDVKDEMFDGYGTTITGVAFLTEEGEIKSLPRPNRHHNLFLQREALGLTLEEAMGSEQGFVTDTGKFLSREPGLIFAKMHNLITRGPVAPPSLFSEDLW